eukprot:SAG22_NODE_8637_length_640_cov_0.942699_1_plen_72_part_10
MPTCSDSQVAEMRRISGGSKTRLFMNTTSARAGQFSAFRSVASVVRRRGTTRRRSVFKVRLPAAGFLSCLAH